MLRIKPYLCIAFHKSIRIVSWCNGSTADFGSACQGSNPCETTNKKRIHVGRQQSTLFSFLGIILHSCVSLHPRK